MRIAIVGGGLGGLAAALFLRRAGLEATVYEQAAELREVGAGIVVSPNMVRPLERLGLVDEYRLVVHPVVAGHGPRLFEGLEPSRRLELVSTKQLKSGQLALHYRRETG